MAPETHLAQACFGMDRVPPRLSERSSKQAQALKGKESLAQEGSLYLDGLGDFLR